jgi:predicted PurR-regulated permease PerM
MSQYPATGTTNQGSAPPVQSESGSAPQDAESVTSSSQWDVSTKRTVWVLLLVFAVFVFWLSLDVLPLLILAGIISYILSPLVDVVARLRVPRTITTLVLYLLVLVAVILLPVFLVPVLLDQLSQLGNFDVSGAAFNLFNWVMGSLNELPETVPVFGFSLQTGQLVSQLEAGFRQITFVPTVAEILTYIQQGISTATGIVSSTAALSVTVVGSIVQTIFAAIIIFFLSLYTTKDIPQIRKYVENLFPSSYQPELREVLQRMGYIWSAFFRGQIVLSLAVFLVTWGALSLVGMPGALILAIVAGVLEVIPQLGPTLAMIPAVIVALIQGSTVLGDYGIGNIGFALLTVGIYFIIQQVENSILVPRIIGGSINLHPIVVICGVAVGLNVFGVLGAFLAAPVIASLRVLGGYIHAKLLDYPPFQDQQIPLDRNQRRRYRRTVTRTEIVRAEADSAEPEMLPSTNALPVGRSAPVSSTQVNGQPVSLTSTSEATPFSTLPVDRPPVGQNGAGQEAAVPVSSAASIKTPM